MKASDEGMLHMTVVDAKQVVSIKWVNIVGLLIKWNPQTSVWRDDNVDRFCSSLNDWDDTIFKTSLQNTNLKVETRPISVTESVAEVQIVGLFN